MVLFLGVTILLASTYTTLYTQDQRGAEALESVVKVAEQQEEKPVETKADILEADNDAHLKDSPLKDGECFDSTMCSVLFSQLFSNTAA